MAIDLGLQAGQALDLDGLIDLVGPLRRGRAWARRILERVCARVADRADDRERRGEIRLGLAGRADDEIGAERHVGARVLQAGNHLEILQVPIMSSTWLDYVLLCIHKWMLTGCQGSDGRGKK